MAGRNSLFFLLFSDCVVYVNILIDSKFLKVFIKLAKTVTHLTSRIDQFTTKFLLIKLDFSVFEVFHLSNIFSPFILILFPILSTFFLPLLHKFLVVLEFFAILQTLILLNSCDKVLFVLGLSQRSVKKVLLSDFKLDEVGILKFLFIRSYVLSAHKSGSDCTCSCICHLHFLF